MDAMAKPGYSVIIVVFLVTMFAFAECCENCPCIIIRLFAI